MSLSIQDYINSTYLNSENIIKLQRYEDYITSLIKSQEPNVVILRMTVEMLYQDDIANAFRSIKNKIIFISSPDIDFPPPKAPYYYDMYFDKSKLPTEYEEINYYDKIKHELIDIIEENNLYVFAHSISINHPRLFFVPIGVFPRFDHFDLKTMNKEHLCYANFGLPIDRWFGNPRMQVLNIINRKDFIIKENISNTHIINRNALNFNYFYNKIAKSKFALCPRGCGIDTYRLWDCISLGCIPVIEKYDGHNIFSKLPVLFLDNISDFENLTEESLTTIYDEFLYKTFNYEQLTFSSIENNLRLCQKQLETPRFGAYLQCHKKPYATYKCLENFRRFYPDSTIVLLSDNGYNYSSMATHFRCIYLHETENLPFIYKDLESGSHIPHSMKLLNRIYNVFKLFKEDYVMWLEDDVIINKKVDSSFNYDINGFCPNRIDYISNIELVKTYDFINVNKEYKYTGHGGSIFNKTNMIHYFENKDIAMDVVKNWKNYCFPADVCQDFYFSVIAILNQGTIGPYHGHADGFDRNSIYLEIAVQHQYKRWYDVDLPEELKQLVNQ